MAAEAAKGLAWRKEYQRGGTRVGATRANQLVRRENLSEETVKRMNSYFARHEVDKNAEGFRPGEKGFPSAGRIAWALWGGDPGKVWAGAISERIKKKELIEMNTTETLETTRSNSAVTKARELIRAGKVKESASWDGPSASAENAFLEAEGFEEFGKFYLGRNSEAAEDTKAHYRYPYSDDFKTVSINGLRAIRGRSAQTGENDIFESSGKLLDEAKAEIEEKLEMPKPSATESRGDFIQRCMKSPLMNEEYPDERQRIAVCHSQFDSDKLSANKEFSTFCLSVESGPVDREAGTIMDISILTEGEAKGHHMMISQKTLESSITLLLGKSLPAYLSHNGANGDRLLTEAGYFSGFYRDKDKIRARKFTALESFKKYDPEKYDRLFEIAEVAPQSFGVSIVFEGQLFWELSDGSEQMLEGYDAPENSRFEIPTIRPLTISSADFVDTPAANGALFSGKVDKDLKGKDMNAEDPDQIELSNESASAHHVSDEEKQAPSVPTPAPEPEPAPKKKGKKKALAEQDEEDRDDERRGEDNRIAEDEQDVVPTESKDSDEFGLEEPDDEYQRRMRAAVEEVYTRVEELRDRTKELMDMTGVPDREEEAESGEKREEMSEIAELKSRVEELTKIQLGTDPIPEAPESVAVSIEEKREELMKAYLQSNPTHNRQVAVLAIAKTNPELFQNN